MDDGTALLTRHARPNARCSVVPPKTVLRSDTAARLQGCEDRHLVTLGRNGMACCRSRLAPRGPRRRS